MVKLSASSDKSVAEQLRDALSAASVRVIDLFRSWDDDGNGKVSKREFRKAMAELQFNAPAAEIDALFDEWDPDKSGSLGIDELNKVLRRGGEVQLSAEMQAGAKGKIETTAKNRSTAQRDGSYGKGAASRAAKVPRDVYDDLALSGSSIGWRLRHSLLKRPPLC